MAGGGPRALIDPLTTPAGQYIKAERAARALEALDALDDDLRSVVIMRVYHDLSREEIADAIGLSVSGVKARLARAFRLMREGFSEETCGE
jgi:RNA polymerase sigma factor (sigma-70 family)